MYARHHWTLAQRLAHYTAPANENGCELWTASVDKWGYGQLLWAGSMRKVHRLTWAEANGPIPEGLNILHHCDVPACRALDHLFPGTFADNTADMVAKGRSALGERNGCAKLTADQVVAIRSDERIQRLIATDYNVDRRLIGMIKSREIWRHI